MFLETPEHMNDINTEIYWTHIAPYSSLLEVSRALHK